MQIKFCRSYLHEIRSSKPELEYADYLRSSEKQQNPRPAYGVIEIGVVS